MKPIYIMVLFVLIVAGCSSSDNEQKLLDSVSVVKTECDDNGVLWGIYKDNHKDILRSPTGKIERCGY